MSSLKTRVLRGGLDALYHSGAYRALAPLARGRGVIFALHHVVPGADRDRSDRFVPNGILEVSPEFLEAVIERTRESGLDIVSMDEAHHRIARNDDRRFAVFTLDDGYRDNLEHAYPVFRRQFCPFTVFVASGLPDGTAYLWWLVLERVIARANMLHAEVGGGMRPVPVRDVAEKCAAWETLYWPLRSMEEGAKLDWIKNLAEMHDVDGLSVTRDVSMSWKDIGTLASDPLVTIGAHTESHARLAGLGEPAMNREMLSGRGRLATMLGEVPMHLAYPYGDAGSAGLREFEAAEKLGFLTAVTMRKGVVFPEHGAHLTALPRVSLNGDYQALRYVDLYISGAPFALYNGFRRVNAA